MLTSLALEQGIGRRAVLQARFLMGTDPINFRLERGDADAKLVLAKRIQVLASEQRQWILRA